MSADETKAIKEKLDALMAAAEEFGNQSAQLSKARSSFDEYIAAASKAEEKMLSVIDKCNEYIDSVHALTEKDFSGWLSSVEKETCEAVQVCREQCEIVSAEYKEALALFERQKPVFEASQEKLAARTEAGFADEAELIRQTAAGLEEKTSFLLRELSDTIDQVKEDLNTTILETLEQACNDLVKLKQKNDVLQSELASVKADLDAAKTWRIKNEVLIKVGAIVAGIAAVASIINLFM